MYKKIICLLLICCFCLFFNMGKKVFSTEYSEDENFFIDQFEEYISEENFNINSHYINSLIGNSQKFTFRKPSSTGSSLERDLFSSAFPTTDDIVQGKSRICYILAALSSIVEAHPEIIKNSIKNNLDETVTIRVFDLVTSKPKLIRVQKTIPSLPRCCSILGKECLWIQMLLKALIASNLGQRACFKLTSSMDYSDIENGHASSVLEMLTGQKVENYNDLSIFHAGKDGIYEIIKNCLQQGSKIITCDFNHNRILATFRNFLPFSASDHGLVFGHVYSVVDAFEDEFKEKWIKIRNPWHGFSVAYDESGNKYVEPDDSKTEGYFCIKLNDFYKSCGSLQILTDNKLKAMTNCEIIKEKIFSIPFKLFNTIPLYFLCKSILSSLLSVNINDNIKILICFFAGILSNLILWK